MKSKPLPCRKQRNFLRAKMAAERTALMPSVPYALLSEEIIDLLHIECWNSIAERDIVWNENGEVIVNQGEYFKHSHWAKRVLQYVHQK